MARQAEQYPKCATTEPKATRLALSGLQKMMLRWQQLHPYNAVQAAVLAFRPTLECVQKAVDQAMAELHFDSVQFSDCLDEVEFSAGTGPVMVTCLRFDTIPGPTFSQFVSNQLNLRFDGRMHCPFRFFLLISQSGQAALAVSYEHAVSDATGITRLMDAVISRLVAPRYSCAWSLDSPTIASLFPAHSRNWKTRSRVGFSLNQVVWHSRCWRPRRQDASFLKCEFRIHAEKLETSAMKAVTAQSGVTVQEFLFAATMEACWHVLNPGQGQFVSASTLVDLRSHTGGALDTQFGLFLGTCAVRHPRAEMSDFPSVLASVHEQCVEIKQSRSYLRASTGLESMARIWDRLPQSINATLGQKLLPVVSGISNVNLSARWDAKSPETPVTNYFRATGLGVILPLMVTLTTVGSQFNLTSTWRPAFYSSTQVDEIMDRIVNRLVGRI